jgi:hypothetical protein
MAEQNQTKEWTKPYHGVQHLGRIADARWATVVAWDSYAELTCWYRGCGFVSVPLHMFDTVEEARTAGEQWVARGVQPAQEDMRATEAA